MGDTADAGGGIASGYKYRPSALPPWRPGHVMVTSAAMGIRLWLAASLFLMSAACAGRPAASRASTASAPTSPTSAVASPTAGPAGSWDCPFPAASDVAKVDEAYVVLQVVVAPDGHAKDVTVIRDPGFGFGETARQCAFLKKYAPARDANGTDIEGKTKPFRVHFSRPAPSTNGE